MRVTVQTKCQVTSENHDAIYMLKALILIIFACRQRCTCTPKKNDYGNEAIEAIANGTQCKLMKRSGTTLSIAVNVVV